MCKAFQAFDISKNWNRAEIACKNNNMTLAQIDNRRLFNKRKRQLYQSPYSSKMYWTGLKYSVNKEKLVWSDGSKSFCNGSLSTVVNCTVLETLDGNACFLITADEEMLKPDDCNVANRFVCQTGEYRVQKDL